MPAEFDLNSIQGLSSKEVIDRLAQDGYNELPSTKKRSIIKIAIEVFREPMFLLLVACGLVYLILGDFEESIMLLGFVFVIMGITLYQERKTERALECITGSFKPESACNKGWRT